MPSLPKSRATITVSELDDDHRINTSPKHRATIVVAELDDERLARPRLVKTPTSAELDNYSSGSGSRPKLHKQASSRSDTGGRLQKSKSLINLPGERMRFFNVWSPDELPPEVVEVCAAAARAQASRLPKDASEVRLARLRQPRGALERRLRRGAAVDDVLDDAALRVAERWLVAIRGRVPEEYLAEAVAHLAHGSLSAKTLPEGPLSDALQRVVPNPRRMAVDGWEFVDALLAAMEIEDSMDKKSVVNAPGPHSTIRLARACGSRPKVWAAGHATSDLARSGFQTDGFRTLATAKTARQGGMVPGPGHYDPASFDLPLSITRPHRGEFAAVGRKRATCITMSLYHRIREL